MISNSQQKQITNDDQTTNLNNQPQDAKQKDQNPSDSILNSDITEESLQPPITRSQPITTQAINDNIQDSTGGNQNYSPSNNLGNDNSSTFPNNQTGGRYNPPKEINQPYSGLQKERELIQKHDEKMIEEIGKELELAKEVKEAGVEKISEEIEIPEIVKKVGVMASGPTAPIQTQDNQQEFLSEDQIKKALPQKITEAVLWFAVWCLRQIKVKKKKEI